MAMIRSLLLLSLLLPAARAAGEDGDAAAELCEDLKKPFFSLAPEKAGGTTATPGRRMSHPFSFTVPKPSGTYRVFLIGESAAGILGAEKEYARILATRLGKPRVEIVNCGMAAYNSGLISPVLEESLELQPDLLVLLSGNNESVRRKVCPGVLPELELRVNTLRTRLKTLSMSEKEAAAAVSLSVHEERLREMARAAAAKGVPLVICTLPANLRDHAPAGDPSPEVLEGIKLLGAGNPAEALRLLGAKNLEKNALALFYSGRAMESLGLSAEAAAKYEAALENDEDDSRSSAARNAMLRRVAAEEGACLADLEKSFSLAARGGITGGTELADGVHWFGRYNGFVYGEIGSAAVGCLSGNRADVKPAAPAQKAAPGLQEFRLLFSYTAAELYERVKTRAGRERPLSERAVLNLERLRVMDKARLRRALLDEKGLGGELLNSRWHSTLLRDLAGWHPGLLLNAAETFSRACDQAMAEELTKRAVAAGWAPGEAGKKKDYCR